MEARDKLIELDKKRQCAGRNLTACVTMLDSGYNSEDIVKVNTVYSKAAVVDFLTLGQKINHDPTDPRKSQYSDMTTQTDFDKLRQPSEAPGYYTPLDKPSDSTLDHGNS